MPTLTLNISECPACEGTFLTDEMKPRLTDLPLWFWVEAEPGKHEIPYVFSCPHCGLSFEFRGHVKPRWPDAENYAEKHGVA